MRIGKLVVFAGLEPGVGKAFCAASIATLLARRWRCLAIELDHRGNLRTFLSLKPADQRAPVLEDFTDSLEPLKIKTGVPNLDFIGWPGSFPRIDRFLTLLCSDPVDYAFATVAPAASDDALAVFAAADVSVIVTHPDRSLEKVFEFLRRLASRDPFGPNVYILLNQVRRGGEEKEAAAFVERAEANLGLKVSILGTAVFDPQAAGGFLHGASLAAFEDIALKIERLLPRTATNPAVTGTVENGKRNGRKGIVAAVMDRFGRKRRQLEEKLRHKELLIAKLQERHESMVDDLQEMLRQKNGEIAEKAGLIDVLESEVRRYKQQLFEQSKRIAENTEHVENLETVINTERRQLHDLADHML